MQQAVVVMRVLVAAETGAALTDQVVAGEVEVAAPLTAATVPMAMPAVGEVVAAPPTLVLVATAVTEAAGKLKSIGGKEKPCAQPNLKTTSSSTSRRLADSTRNSL